MSKTLSLVKLPGLKPGDSLECKVVAVIRRPGLWSAYAGSSDATNLELIKRGDRLDRKTAESLFFSPSLKRYKYKKW